MVNALSVWGTSVASTTLGTAGKLAIGLGGVSSPTTSKIGTATGFGELTALGTAAAWAAAGSIFAPTGLGWILDPAQLSLVGQDIVAGTWTPKIRIKAGSGNVTGDVYMRSYKRSSGGVYTSIGSMVASGITLTSAFAAFSPTPGSLLLASFLTGDVLYIDAILNAVTNAGGAAAVITIDLSNTTSGLANCVEIATPGYQASTGSATTLKGMGRFKMVAPTTLKGMGRFKMFVPVTRKGQGRFKLLAIATRKGQGRFKMVVPSTLKGMGRFNLSTLPPGTSILANNAVVSIYQPDGIAIDEKVSTRSTATFTVIGSVAAQLQQNMSIIIYNSNLGQRFVGTIDSLTLTRITPNNQYLWRVTCKDSRYKADKRVFTGQELSGYLAGDAVAIQHQQVLAAEGVSANYAMRVDNDLTTWGQGTLTNVIAASNAASGDLELALAGTPVTKTESTNTDWNAGTLTNVHATSNQLSLNSHAALSFSGYCSAGFGNAFAYYRIWSGSYLIKAGDYLAYKMWISSDSPQIMSAIDGSCSDGTTIRDFASTSLADQNGLLSHAKADLAGYANDQWYYRKIDLSGMAGKTLVQSMVVFEGDTGGQYQSYFYDVQIENAAGVQQRNLYGAGGAVNGPIIQPSSMNKVGSQGYSNVLVKAILAYESAGNRISPAVSVAAAGITRSSSLSWAEAITTPAGTALTQYASLDGGATWQLATNGGVIPNLIVGASLAGLTIKTKQVFALTGKNPTTTPVVASVTYDVQPSYTATKSDVKTTYNTQANWNTGTKTNVVATAGGDLTINSYQKDWNNASTANQTLFGATSPGMGTFKRYATLTTGATSDAKIRLDGAGNWQDFTASVDVQVTSASVWVGITYRTTNWINAKETYAYKVDMNLSGINLDRSTNGGASATTVLASAALSLTPNDWHTITLVVAGSLHTVYLDGVQYISFTDSTYTAGGGIGLIINNNTAGSVTGSFNNFGVMVTPGVAGNSPAPQWVSPLISLGLMTVGNSLVQWEADATNGALITVLASVNGGAYVACTNGAVVPGLTPGTSLTSGTVQYKIQLQSQDPADSLTFHGLTSWVSSSFSSSGSRISPSLSFSGINGRLGATSLTWVPTTPPSTNVLAETSINAGGTWQTIASPGNPIVGINNQPDQVAEDFVVDNSANYSATFQSGGVVPVATWDTANSRLSLAGGTNGLYIWSTGGPSFQDGTLTAVVTQGDNVGLVMRYSNPLNFYKIVVRDDQSTNAPAQTLLLIRRVAGVDTTLASVAIPFARGEPHTLMVTMLVGQLTIWWDGTQKILVNDASPLLQVGTIGVYQHAVTAPSIWYSLTAQAVGDDPTGKSALYRLTLSSTDPAVTPTVTAAVLAARGPQIMSGAILPSTAYKYKNVASNVDDAAKRSNHWWAINNLGQLLFQNRQASLAPWPLWSGLRADGSCDMKYAPEPRINHVSPSYRNRQYIINAYDTVTSVEKKQGNGVATSWNLGAPIISVTSILVNGATRTVGIQGVDTNRDFYYKVGDTTIAQDQNAAPMPGNAVAVITFQAQVPYTAMKENAAQQAVLRGLDTSSSGIVENVEDGTGLNKAAADALAQARIDQYARLTRDWGYTTDRAGLSPGHYQSMFAPEFNLNDTDMLILGIKTRITRLADTSEQWLYDVTCSEGPPLGSWARVFALPT